MNHFGIDLHGAYDLVALLDSNGEIHEYRFDREQREQMVELIRAHQPCGIAMEACTGAYLRYDLLVGIAERIQIIDGRAFRQRFPQKGQKTDSKDAANLALASSQQVGGIWVPDEKVRQARFLAHVRISMTKRRTMSKNIVQSILREYGLKKPTGCNSGQWSVPGKERLRALARRLPDAVAACLEAELRLIESTTEEIEGLDERIAALSAADPEVQLLMSIPGLDYYSAFVIKSEVGDFRRFHSAKQLTCYAGLAPSVRQSGSYCVHGRITKKGRSALRWMTVECALAARRGSPKLSRFYERVRRKSRMAAKAKVATGRKILELCWHIIRSGQTYSEYDPAKYDVKLRRMRHRGGRAQKTCATGDCARGG